MIGIFLLTLGLSPKILEVGPGKEFGRIEDAIMVARKGDAVHIYPHPSGYPGTAILLTVPLTIRGIGPHPVAVKGDGFDYSGVGSIPRAIFQIEPSASGSKIENLDLSGAHNSSYNGAGIRVQASNDVEVRDCIIHDNDMGIMSNGKNGDPSAGSNQLIEYCLIEKNGNLKDPGYNHNLYLGGTSVHLSHCEIRNSTTGHNLKSRAHYLLVDYCWIHDAANREIDLPEAWDTERPNSNAVLIGNQIIKDPKCTGNRGVIHFGQEKGTRNGSLYMFGNIVFTPFASPVILVTSPGAAVVAKSNYFLNPEQSKADIWTSTKGNLQISALNLSVSPCYRSTIGGSIRIAAKRTDLFGLVPPRYKSEHTNGTGTIANDEWIDGDGVKQSVKSDTGNSFNVGPRVP